MSSNWVLCHKVPLWVSWPCLQPGTYKYSAVELKRFTKWSTSYLIALSHTKGIPFFCKCFLVSWNFRIWLAEMFPCCKLTLRSHNVSQKWERFDGLNCNNLYMNQSSTEKLICIFYIMFISHSLTFNNFMKVFQISAYNWQTSACTL